MLRQGYFVLEGSRVADDGLLRCASLLVSGSPLHQSAAVGMPRAPQGTLGLSQMCVIGPFKTVALTKSAAMGGVWACLVQSVVGDTRYRRKPMRVAFHWRCYGWKLLCIVWVPFVASTSSVWSALHLHRLYMVELLCCEAH